jgi:hypothetical protein
MPNLKGTMVCSYTNFALRTMSTGRHKLQPAIWTDKPSKWKFSDKAIVDGAYDPKPYLFAIYLK